MYETSHPVNTNVYNNGVRENDTSEYNYSDINSHEIESEFISPQEKEIDEMSGESETGSHANVSEPDDLNEEEIDETEANQQTSNNTYNNNNYISNEFEANSFQNANQQIRRRPIHQQLRELSSSSNDNTNERPSVIKRRKLRILHIIPVIIILISAFFYLQYGNNSSFFQKFFDTTNNSSVEGINITYTIGSHLNKLRENLKSEEDKLDVTIKLCKDGKTDKVEGNLRSLNVRISPHLRNFGEEIMVVSKHLYYMYSKREEVYKALEMEIEAMTNRLNSNDKGDVKYFEDTLNNLIVIIEEFIKLTEDTQSSLQQMGSTRNNTESQIHKGLEKFGNLTTKYGYYHCHSNDDAKSKKEREAIKNILDHLNNAADQLIKIENFLKDYKCKLMGVSSELDGTGKGDDGMFEVTKITDFEHLKLALSTI